MPLHCAAFGCKNRNGSCDSQISFHRFPLKNLKLLSEWILKIRRKAWNPTQYSRLCSSHFTPEDYINKPGVKRKFLKDDAVPTIFNFSSTFLQPSIKRPLIRTTPNVSNECWRDRKSHLKVKAEKRDACISVGTDPSPYQLNDLEERLLELIQENAPDYTKNVIEGKKHNHLKEKKYIKNLNVEQTIKYNQNFRISNKPERSNINQIKKNPVSQLSTINNIPKKIISTSYLFLAVDAKNAPLRLQTLTPPSLTSEQSNTAAMKIESHNDSSIKNDNILNLDETNISNGPCVVKDSKLSKKDGSQDSEQMNNYENVDSDVKESTAKEINSISLVSKSVVSNDDEDVIVPRNKSDEESISDSDEDSVEEPPRKKVRFANHTESPFLTEDQGELIKVIERQNGILEGMARSLARIEKSLGERSADNAQRKNSMLIKISDNLEQLGESLKVVSKSLKSIGES